jgi:hypothetical protein
MTGERLTWKPSDVQVGGALTPSQRAYNCLRDELEEQVPGTIPGSESEAAQVAYRAGLARAMALLLEIDPEADPGEAVPGRVY